MKGLIFVLMFLLSLLVTSCVQEEVCSPNPCQNDGVCSESLASYTCECGNGFIGDNCEIKQCTSNNDCLQGETCKAGICVDDSAECQSDSNCLNGYHCENNECIKDPVVCVPIDCMLFCENGFKKDADGCETCECNEEIVCVTNSDCFTGQVCKAGVCVDDSVECQSDFDCLNGYHCEMTYCGNNTDEYCGDNSGVCVKDPIVCDDVLCEMYCENGFKKDANGCEICECNEVVVECRSSSDCAVGQVCEFDSTGGAGKCVPEEKECLSDFDCLNGYHCEMTYCGNNTDEYCGDNSGVCVKDPVVCEEVLCDLYCENGFKVDENGCEICACNEVTTQCLSDSDCLNNQHCELLDGCYLDENGEIICPQSGICVDNELPPECQSDFDCLNGQICFFLDYSNVGTCIQEEAVCNVDTDCLTGQACIDGLCQERACLPVVCDLYCENGFQIDANGCEMCVCNEPPMECLDDSQCFNGYHCELMDCYDPTGLDCNGGGICVKDADPNQCGSDISCAMGEVCVNGECVPEPSCDCYEIYSPVCGTDNITYGNDCEANCANVEIAYSGVCR